MHDAGYIHRDVKPSNFCIGLGDTGKSYVLDFGLARRWRTVSGEVRAPRESADFRGTCRYASVHSHQSQELSRRDDMWSLLYMLLELHQGDLPWHATKVCSAPCSGKPALPPCSHGEAAARPTTAAGRRRAAPRLRRTASWCSR